MISCKMCSSLNQFTLLPNILLIQILVDTRSVQKEINSLTGKLDRTFTVTDELIFKVSVPLQDQWIRDFLLIKNISQAFHKAPLTERDKMK